MTSRMELFCHNKQTKSKSFANTKHLMFDFIDILYTWKLFSNNYKACQWRKKRNVREIFKTFFESLKLMTSILSLVWREKRANSWKMKAGRITETKKLPFSDERHIQQAHFLIKFDLLEFYECIVKIIFQGFYIIFQLLLPNTFDMFASFTWPL